jgi:hypothetical protein
MEVCGWVASCREDFQYMSEDGHIMLEPKLAATIHNWSPPGGSPCPVCTERCVERCKCDLGDSRCKNGHDWFTCPVHQLIVLGNSDHNKGYEVCQCRPAE